MHKIKQKLNNITTMLKRKDCLLHDGYYLFVYQKLTIYNELKR